ncbi:MAG TPA: ferritin-like domain-containing protein [Solirubrobacterales bacterium]|jgi:rubrerythrin
MKQMKTPQMQNPELAEVEVDLDRGSFLVKGALAVGAIYGSLAAGPFVRRALAQKGSSDVDILNFALTLEYLESAFYEQGLKTAKLGAEQKMVAQEIASNEMDHVNSLMGAISDMGGKPVEAPGVDFGNAVKSESAFLKLAQTFEDTGVSAYNGAGPMLKSKEVLGVAGSIVQVEARHAARIRLLNGETPAPDPFDPPLTMDEVLKAVQPYVKS